MNTYARIIASPVLDALKKKEYLSYEKIPFYDSFVFNLDGVPETHRIIIHDDILYFTFGDGLVSLSKFISKIPSNARIHIMIDINFYKVHARVV